MSAKQEGSASPAPTPTPVPAPAAASPAPTPAPATPQPAPPTPAQYSQWSSHIPIDPALQQQQQQAVTPTSYQHYQYYASHYPQYAQQTSHLVITPPTAPTARPAAATTSTATTTAAAPSQGNSASNDISTLNDAIGSAGVDLRAEEESLQRAQDSSQSYNYRSFEDRTRKQPSNPAFDTRTLGTVMRSVGTQHKVTRIPEDSINYVALALRARLQDLLTSMITAAKHRTDTQFDRPASLYEDESPMWGILVRADVAKQIVALEKVEREDETRIRRERKERADMAAAQAAALAAQVSAASLSNTGEGGFDEEGGPKKKRKKDGPGVTARNMSDDVRKKMSNAVASQAAGLNGKKYSWMNAAPAATPAAAATPAPKAKSMTPGASSPLTTTPAASAGGSWARPYVSSSNKQATPPPSSMQEQDERLVITMRDAMFVVEKERGHGGGRGAARGWV